VLVDSEVIVNRVFADMLNELGVGVTLEYMFEHFVGHSMVHCMTLVRELLGREPPPDFESTHRERTRAALSVGLTPVPGIVETLSRLTVPFCVASSGDHDKMRTTLGITGLLPRLDGRLFSVTEVPRGKPFPDVFLHAARSMGAAPERTAVVEDTPVGAQAGRAAGMMVFGYAAHTPPERLRAVGAVVFTDMAELPRLLE
jgi:HAD superfamily hydrolase (TIGR01509 family)